MKVKLFAVLDSASGIYDGPVPAQTKEVALRNFTHMARNDDSPIGKNPECFSLWQVGEWNDGTGEVVPEAKFVIANAIDLITPNEEN